MDYIVASENNGAIIGAVGSNVLYKAKPEYSVSADTHYWDLVSDQFAEREPIPASVVGMSIEGIPCSGTFEVSGPLEHVGNIIDSTLAFVFDIPGVYAVTLMPDSMFPRWLPTTFEIEVLDE